MRLFDVAQANSAGTYQAQPLDEAGPGEEVSLPDYPRALAAMQRSRDEADAADEVFFAVVNRELDWRSSAPQTARLRLRRQR
ncbi:MAG: hypothetical protein ACLQFR_26805 [Streptosporangiaceae bacterium]